MKSKFYWYVINKEYINHLKYYVPISSVKEKHYKMSENIDFIKITDGNNLISVINLNNMIPIPLSQVTLLNYEKISNYYLFKSIKEKSNYIALLRKEMAIINRRKKEINIKAKRVYIIKNNYPESKISLRCCDFKLLEEKCKEYK